MRQTITATIALIVLVLASMAPAAAQQTAQEARAEAWGAQVSGIADLGPLPDPVVAEAPGGQASDSFVEVPAEPLVLSATLSGNVEAAQDNVVTPRLQGPADEASTATLPTAWNAAGHAITEDLAVLFTGGDGGGELPEELDDLLGELGDGGSDGGELDTSQQQDEPLLTAEVVEAEAQAGCVNGSPTLASASRVQHLTFGGERLDLLDEPVELLVQGEPNEDVLANTPGGEALAEAGLEITAWETNWDGATGTTDGSDTVEVNALRVSVAEGSPLGDAVGAQDVTVSHGQASVSCGDEGVGPGEEPVPEEPGDVEPVGDQQLPVTGGGVSAIGAAVLLGAGAGIAAVRRWAA